MTTAPPPESALWERVRRSEADIAQLGERVTRIGAGTVTVAVRCSAGSFTVYTATVEAHPLELRP